ncbi:guanine nucleotide-binding protein-like NSN1 [Vigna unguiculata]|uniref:Nuclear GTP-binding protein n=1 Tax=Vigna unguiculata TaxID=3917 RepID=A0A4D6NC08_VIGUN|nr:guanine nucleotide-binding protein-like NSN1 [Vigna unguiculata]QCE10442.1 nuclear GTP-binding protein [Vigna unguiculata]
MVKKSKKSKSKRISLKKKYKVIRKVKEHNQKKAKEARKLQLSGKKKVEKDPGIPNDWPFKEQELKAIEARRAKAIEELEQKKAERKERARKRKLGLLEEEDDSKLLEDSKTNSNDFGTALKTRDSSDRAFYKDLVKVIEASDVLLEVLDARDPLGTRCPEIESMVMKSGPDKRLVLLLNKIDLVPKEALEKWLKYLREELPTVAFKCSTQQQRSNLAWRKSSKKGKSSNVLQLSDCLGADTLLKLLKNYSRSHEIKKSITVGLIGLPNVGKSSLINSLKRSHVVNVGSTPGLTRSMQEVQLDKNVKLLDCPGVVMLKSKENDASIALKNCKRIENLQDPIGPVKEILKLCLPEQRLTLYNIPSFNVGDVDDFLRQVAIVKGKLKTGGILDIDTTARIVLRDWNEGKIQYYTMPPNRDQGEPSEAKIVSEFAKEFNVDEVYNNESSYIGSLKSVDDFSAVEVPSSHPHPLDLTEMMLEDETETKLGNQGEGPGNVGEVDEAMEDDGGKKKDNSAASRQNEKLYTADGMLNTKLRCGEKKKRKKAKKASASSDPMDGYNFKTDYFQASMDSEDSQGEDDDDEPVKSEVPISAIQIDE